MPMTVAEVRAIVEEHINEYAAALQVNTWRIYVAYEADAKTDWAAQVSLDLDYRIANITFCCNSQTDPDNVRSNLQHELIHILLAPFELYAQSMQPFFESNPAAQSVHSRMRTFAGEQMVGNIERALRHGLNDPILTPPVPAPAPEPAMAKPKKPTKRVRLR